MVDLALRARARTTLGKNVKRLRRAGVTPANIYGHNVPSVAIEADTHELSLLLRRAGRTHIVQVSVEGEALPRPALIKNYTRRPTTDQILHVDFFQISLMESLHVDVPIVIVGIAPVVDTESAILNQNIATISVACLPGDIPASIEVDVSGLVDTASSLYVRDLTPPAGVTILTDPDIAVVTITASRAEVAADAAEAAETAEAPDEES